MDVPITSHQNRVRMHPAQYPSRRRQYAEVERQYHDKTDKRLVRIRNPEYVTPSSSSMRVINYAHQYSDNNEYHQATSPSFRPPQSDNPSSISATPRRGPWRYMEVNNQWLQPDSHPQSTNGAFSSYVPSQETLRDEFDGRDFDLGVARRQNYEEEVQNEREIENYAARRYLRQEERNFEVFPSPDSYAYTSNSHDTYSPRSRYPRESNQNHILPSSSSQRAPENAHVSPMKHYLGSPHGIRHVNNVYTPSFQGRHLTSPRVTSQIAIGGNHDSLQFGHNILQHKANIERERKRITRGVSINDGRHVFQENNISTASSSRINPVNSTPSGTPEPMIQDDDVSQNEESFGRYDPLESIDATNASPRRNSTPFLHRPRILFQEKCSPAKNAAIPSDIRSPVLDQIKDKMSDALEKGSPSKQPASENAIELESKRSKPQNKKANVRKSNDLHQKIKAPKSSAETSSETELEQLGHQKTLAKRSQETNKRPKIQKELASLYSSNSFFGFLSDDKKSGRRNPRAKKQINECSDTETTSARTTVPSKASKQFKSANNNRSVSTSDEEANATKTSSIKEKDVSANTTIDDSVFKLPLPPSIRPKTRNSNKSKANISENISSKKTNINSHSETTDNNDERYLKNWTPKLKGKKLLFEGEVLNIEDDIANTCRYLTSKIIERVTATTVKTKKRHYILEGKLNVREAEKYDTPRFIIDSFMHGVPEKWEAYRDQWRKFSKEQRHMLFGSSASISSWSSVSSFDHASGFLDSTKGSLRSNKNDKTEMYFSNDLNLANSEQEIAFPGLRKKSSLNKSSPSKVQEVRLDTSKNDSKHSPKNEIRNSKKREKNISNSRKSNNNASSTVNAKQKVTDTIKECKDERQKGKADSKNRNQPSSRKNKTSKMLQQGHVEEDENSLNQPKTIKELYMVERDRKRRNGNVGKCIVCSACYSIPYIERHINDKHPKMILKQSGDDGSPQNSSNILAHTSYLRPRVILTKLTSPNELNKECLRKSINIKTGRKAKHSQNEAAKSKTNEKLNSSDRHMRGKQSSKKPIVKCKSNQAKSSEESRSKRKSHEGKRTSPLNDSSNRKKGQHNKQPIKSKINSKEKSHNNKNKKQCAQHSDQNSKEEELPEKESEDSFEEVNLKDMVIKPKTIKDLQANTRVLNALNKNHKDDIFSSNKTKKKEVPKLVKQGPKDILEDLFDSDSENDLSLHSARTPIGRFFERSDSRTPANNESIQSEDDIYRSQSKNDYQQDAFINRKVKETRRRSRMTNAFSSSSASANILQSFNNSSRKLIEKQSNDLVKPISNLLVQSNNVEEDTDEDMESYFSEDQDSFTRSVADPPQGLLDMFTKEKAGKTNMSSIRRNY